MSQRTTMGSRSATGLSSLSVPPPRTLSPSGNGMLLPRASAAQSVRITPSASSAGLFLKYAGIDVPDRIRAGSRIQRTNQS